MIIEGNPGADNAQQRKLGFDRLAVKEGKLDLLESRTAHWETEEANTVFTNMLTAHPEVQGVMAANDSMALGVVKAIDAAGKSGKIQVVGFDNIPAVQPLLKEGKMMATIDQFGSKMAANGIDYAMKALKGEKLEGWIKTPIRASDCTRELNFRKGQSHLGKTGHAEMEPILELRGICKRFPASPRSMRRSYGCAR